MALGVGSGLVLLPGCGGGDATSGPQTVAAPTPAPSPDPFQDLANRITGAVLRPGNAGFAAAERPQNLRYADVQSTAVVVAATASDVQQTVLWARRNGLPLVARSGGHSYGGFSTTTGILLSLAALNGLSVDPATGVVSAGPGALNQQIYPALAPFNLAIPAGRCPTVAAGGLTLGGGFGFTSRTMGTTSDQLIETDVVLADGSVLTCNAQVNADLFWACRGGGGGNFGINTGYRFQGTPVGDTSWYEFKWDVASGALALRTLQKLVGGFPDRLSVRAGIGVEGPYPRVPGSGGVSVNAIGLYLGPQSEMEGLLAPLVAAAPPQSSVMGTGSFTQAARFTFLTTPVDYYAVKSAYARDVLSDATIDTLLTFAQEWPGSSNNDGAGVAMFLWGGALNAVPRTSTAFVHRDARWLVALETSWEATDNAAAVSANLVWLQGLYDAVRPSLGPEAYQNFIDPTLGDWPEAYYAENLPRLVEIKSKYDPDRFFQFPQAIPPTV
jgi:hypothetical protein